MKSSPLIWHYVVNVQSMVHILSIFEAFKETMDFIVDKSMPIMPDTSEFVGKTFQAAQLTAQLRDFLL